MNEVAGIIASNKLTVVVGIGATGLSVARHLARSGRRFLMVDSRTDPPALPRVAEEFPEVPVELGEISADTLCSADTLVVSPGIPLSHGAIRRARDQGVTITGDIQLFADSLAASGARVPVIAITGSNGKSTVTTLLGEMARACGRKAGIGGNLGTPALDLLDEAPDLYVLELSSFQLELVENLNAEVATVLNISPDHMDRYPDLMSYYRAKHRVFSGVSQVVVNRDDPLSRPLLPAEVRQWTFGMGVPDLNSFGIADQDGKPWLTYSLTRLMPVSAVAMRGRHNIANALAALALGHALGLSMDVMLDTLTRFPGLPHRCETVAQSGGVTWINDSKATNTGAAIAAIEGLAGSEPDLVLIAGGQGKGQDFSPLATAARGRVRVAVLLGEDGPQLAEALNGAVELLYATSMEGAVTAAAAAARPGDKVLLSPACASFDMFSGFEERGRRFAAAVEGLL